MDKLLISTSKRLVLWDKVAHTLMEMDDPNHLFYGITWSPEEIYVVAGPDVLTFDKDFNPTGKLPFHDLWGAHQCYWWDGKVYVFQSPTNEIFVWDGKEVTTLPYPYFKKGIEDPHLNSMWCDDNFFYVAEHWQQELPKIIRVFDLDWNPVTTVEIEEEAFGEGGHSGIHNVYWEGGYIITLGPGVIICARSQDLTVGIGVDVRGYEGLPNLTFTSYLRGLARTNSNFYVGVSQLAGRDQRHLGGDAMVLKLDDSLGLEDVILLKDTGQLCDIRCIDPLDHAHNRVPCPYKGKNVTI